MPFPVNQNGIKSPNARYAAQIKQKARVKGNRLVKIADVLLSGGDLASATAAGTRRNQIPIVLSKNPVIFAKQHGLLKPKAVSSEGWLKRLADPEVWSRHFFVRERRWADKTAPSGQFYTSHLSIGASALTDESQDRFAVRHVAVSQSGDLAVIPTSDQKRRRRFAELLTRGKGISDIATAVSMVPVLLTLTCPSRFHRTKSRRLNGETIRVKNSRWDGTTPADGQKWLSAKWRILTRRLNKAGIAISWIRVVQPHKSGCPHWHIVLFACESDLADIENRVEKVFVKETPEHNEKGAERRVDFKPIKGGAGGAIAYVSRCLRYISRDLGIGASVADQEEADRAAAWSRTWGIRCYQTSHDKATLWREIRGGKTEYCGAALKSANQGDYAGFLHAVEDEGLAINYDARVGKYGEAYSAVSGLSSSSTIFTRSREWTLAVNHIKKNRILEPKKIDLIFSSEDEILS
ncbi:MAG: replication endonuclease [Pseudohongiella sp.]|nr:replication endonuclease [Pseudohongiella sp.]